MKKILYLILTFITMKVGAQNVIYSDTFTVSSSYASGSSQYDNWNTFRGKLDTISNKFLKLTMKGTLDNTGRSCTDPTAVRKIAMNMKNATTAAVTCGSYTWNTYPCGGGVELSADGTTCNCVSGGYTVRPQIGNSSWGGINAYTCGGSTQRMTVIFEKPSKNNDLTAILISTLDVCQYIQTIKFKVGNYGINLIDSFYVGWSLNGTNQTPIKFIQKIKVTGDTTVTLKVGQSFSANTNYTIKAWTYKPNGKKDSVPANDTTAFILKFLGGPGTPTTSDIVKCGTGRATLKAVPANPADSIVWYDAITGGNQVAKGKSTLSPFLNYGVTTFYAEATKAGSPNFINNSLANGTIVSGSTGANCSWIDVKPLTGTVVIDSFMARLYQYTPGTTYDIYYKTGTFGGFETNGSVWTKVGSGTVNLTTGTYGNMAYLKIPPLTLQGGTQYSFHIVITGNDFYLGNGVLTGANAELTYSGGSVGQGTFGSTGVYKTWTQDLRIFYRPFSCSGSSRIPLKVTIKPTPTGSDIIKGSPFQGQLKSGTLSDPDIIAAKKILTYELTPPKGFTNANYNSKWVISDLRLKSNKGYTLPGTDYSVVLPTASTNAILTFKPLTKYEDSTITVYLTLADLGPNFCDTLIKRVIYVAATPVANFKFPQPICDGTPVLFENTSKIAKGDMTYKWYFGDGDSSENVNPVHTFKTYGSYQTRLSATSIKFGIITDTIITVDISEIPSASFKSINACEGTAVKFINQTTVSSGTLTYDWNFGDASTHLTTQNPTHLYSAAGGYKVTLTATTNGCSNAVSKNVYEFAKPKPDFVVPVSSVCASTPVTFPNNSTIALGEAGAYWQFGDGNNSTSRVGLNNYKTDGTFTVKLKMVSEFGCTDSINKQVIIKAAPVASFNNSAPCSVDPTVFINTTTFKPGLQPSYTWTFSDGGTANTTNVSHSWANVGPKNIKLRALQPNGCESTIEKNIVVAVQPNAAFTVADICSGKEAVFQNQTTVSEGNLNYTWDFGDGSPVSNISDPLHMYTVGASQTFNVLLVTNAGGICVDSARSVVTVSEAPVCDFTTKIEWAFGHRTIKFTPTNSSYTSYSWTFGEGGTSSSASPLYSYFYDGNFKVKMTAKNAAGCDCSKEIKVPVFANTDIKEIGEGVNIEVFPNPNSGLFTIVTDGSDNDIVEIEIFNTIGEKVYTGNVNGNAADVDLGDAAKGIYIIKVKTKGKTSTRKVSIN